MRRGVAPIVFVVAVLLAPIGVAARPASSAVGLAQETPTATPTPPPEECAADPEKTYLRAIDVDPWSGDAAITRPIAVTGGQDFYLVAWTVPPGICIPYDAEGNKKDGAVILMVEQGVIAFRAEEYDPSSGAEVLWGRPWSDDGSALPVDMPQTLYPGDWVTMSGQVWFTFESVGDEDAVVYKAVWAVPPDDVGVHGGSK